MSTRFPVPDDLQRLKGAFRDLVEAAGGLVAAEVATRVKKTSLAAYYHANHLHRFPPLDVIAALEAEAKDPIVTRELARQAGFHLAALSMEADACLSAAIGEAVKEGADAACAHLLGRHPAVVQREALEAIAAFSGVAALAGVLAKGSPTAPAVKGEGVPADCSRATGDGGGRDPGTPA